MLRQSRQDSPQQQRHKALCHPLNINPATSGGPEALDPNDQCPIGADRQSRYGTALPGTLGSTVGLVLPQPSPSPAARSGSARENISTGNVKSRPPSYKPQQLSPAGSPCPASLRTRAKRNISICSYGHESWARQQRSCSLRCTQQGPAMTPQAEEESQPNPEPDHIHHTTPFGRGRNTPAPFLGKRPPCPDPALPLFQATV